MTARRLARVACLATMAALAGFEFQRIFGWGPVGARVAGAAVLAAAVPVALQWRRPRHVALTISVSVVLLFVYLLVAVQMTAPVDAPGGVLDGVVNGWSRLLTTTIPAPPRGDLLILPVLLTWLAALLGVELAMRTRLAVLAITPSAVAYVLALLFTVGTGGSRVLPAIGWTALAVGAVRLADVPAVTGTTGVAGDQPAAHGRIGSRIALPTILFLVSVVAFAAIVGPRLPGADATDPVDPRESQTPPLEDLTAINPMALLSEWARSPDEELFVVEAETPAAWRLAVLDEYDGAQWSAATELAATGARLPTDPASGDGPVDQIDQAYTIRGLGGVWLPAAARPVELTGLGAFVDPGSGILARPEGVREGLRYRVVSERVRDASCDTAPVTDPGTLSISTSEANTPYQQRLQALAAEITSGITSPCERARAIQQYLSSPSNFQFDPQASGGSHLRAMSDFLTAERRGTSEQFASAFAILGRYAGLPTRVVVGFHAGEEDGGGARRWLVKSSDAFAWAEVRFDGVGWVGFDPTPTPDGAPTPPEDIAEEEAKPETPTDESTADAAPRVVERESDAQQAAAGGTSLVVQILVGIAVVLGVVAAVLGLLTLVARLGWNRRRRRRRTVPGARRQIVGAWWEALDALEDRGVDADRGRTAAQWVHAGIELVEEDLRSDLGALASAVNAALFSPAPPTDGDVTRAWAHADAVRQATRAGMTRGERVRWLLDPRPWFGNVPGPLGDDEVVRAPEAVSR